MVRQDKSLKTIKKTQLIFAFISTKTQDLSVLLVYLKLNLKTLKNYVLLRFIRQRI